MDIKKQRKVKPKPINWNEWNPFVRATGDALRQLNKRQKTNRYNDEIEDALL